MYRHYKPELLTEEQISQGILVQSIPEPSKTQSNLLKYDGKRMYYEDTALLELQEEAEVIQANEKKILDRVKFAEDVVAEIAYTVYP